MKTIKQTILGFALSVLSITATAQCLTSVSVSATSDNSGNVTASQVFNVPTNTVTSINNEYALYGNNGYYYAGSTGMAGTGSFANIPSGTYTLCINDSLYCGGLVQNLSDCISVTVTNTTVAAPCNATFTYFQDSLCNTHFINQSTGSNLTYQWYINGNMYTVTNPVVSLPNGTVFAQLYTYSSGSLCDVVIDTITLSCSGGTVSPAPCQASFSYYTDSFCNTMLNNQSTGSNLNSYWSVDGIYYSGTNQSLQLSNGSHLVSLYNYSNGAFCDSTTQMINVACNSGTVNPAGCQANSSFIIFGDSLNHGNYFAFNMSSGSGSMSYLWSFGDGSTSTQQYPFHQYATPGHYVVCLTVTSTSGTTTCTDSYCDSSSVQRVASGFLMHQINVIPQGTAAVKESNIVKTLNAYPNPMSDELSIEVELNTTVSGLTCTIMDALGKVVSKNSINGFKTSINTSSLEKGFYFLSISTQEGKAVKTIKLVK